MAETGDDHWDAFVSHAWEDKDSLVRPLVEALGRLGISLWYDETSLRIGDSLSESINRGIAKSHNGIVVISPAFLEKNWPTAELHTLMARRIDGKLRLLQLWHNVKKDDIAARYPMLADLVALPTADRTAQDLAIALLAEIRPDVYERLGRSELERLATGQAFEDLEDELAAFKEKVSELLCPTCEAPLIERILSSDWSDPLQADIDEFECGCVIGGHWPRMCPHDPLFPPLSDYEVTCAAGSSGLWSCQAKPRTTAAKRHHLGHTDGLTEAEARARLLEMYNRGAPREKQVQKPG